MLLQQVCGPMQNDTKGSETIRNFLAEKVQSLLDLRALSGSSDAASRPAGQSSHPSVWSPGFSSPPGGPDYLNRTVFSWHYYCWATNPSFEAGTQP